MIYFIKKFLAKIISVFKKKGSIIINQKIKHTNISFFKNVEFKNSKIEEYSYIANNSIVHNTTIGKFCSIGPNAVIGFGDHPTYFLSTSPAFYNSECDFDIRPLNSLYFGHEKVEIGNDVWVGANVFIKNGLKIGDGAVIGAGSVILKDVEPYSIVVGVPGKIKSKRFSDDIVLKLQKLEWWDWPIEIIRENYDFMTSDKIIQNIDTLFEIKDKIQ